MRPNYLPILKAKPGEFAALHGFSSFTKSQIRPLIEIGPAAKSREKEDGTWSKPQTLEVRTKAQAKAIAKAWFVEDLPILVDTHFLLGQEAKAMELLLRAFRALKAPIRVVPVTGLNLASIASCKGSHEGACLRLSSGDTYKIGLERQISSFLSESQLVPEQIDLVVDCGFISNDSGRLHELSMALRGSLPVIPNLQRWRTFALAGGSFPATIQPTPYWFRFGRAAWLALWREVRQQGYHASRGAVQRWAAQQRQIAPHLE